MNSIIATIAGILISLIGSPQAQASQPGAPENALSVFRSVRLENTYTRVPSSGKLAAIKITDNGRIYYVCREKNGYAIYHLEVRPAEGFKTKIEEELKSVGEKWETIQHDELLFTKERLDSELKKKIYRYSDAVWVRNEIVMDAGSQDGKTTPRP